jgi:hypothetical protein
MAKLYGEIAAKALLTLDKSFARANGQPLDASEVYYSLAAAKEYAAGAQAYIGQKIVVIENGVVTHYGIEDAAGSLKELGSKPVADGTTVAIGEDGKITLANIAAENAEGTYNAVLVNGVLTWVKPSETTVEGLSDLINALTTRVDGNADAIAAEKTRAEAAEAANAKAIEDLEASVAQQIADAVAGLLDDAPEAYDTLKEISDWIASHPNEVASLNSSIKANSDAIDALELLVGDKAVATQITDALADYATVASLADYVKSADVEEVHGQVASNTNSIANLTSRLDGIVAQGGEPNVINNIKVNGVVQQIVDKAVDVIVPTKVSDLTDDTGFDARITAAQNRADKGVEDAAAAQTKANEAAASAEANATAIGELNTTVAGHTEAINDHGGRITALENADKAHASEYSALKGIVDGHAEAIAKKADSTTVDGVIAKAGANEAAIQTLNDTTIPAINEAIAKKADATQLANYHTKDEIAAITGQVAEGKTLVQMISEAQTAATYDDTAVKALITAEETRAKAAEQANADEIARVNGVLVAALENDAEGLDSIKELADWIGKHGNDAAEMTGAISANTAAIAAINDETNGILATAKSYADTQIAAIPAATVEALGLVRYDGATIMKNENNQLYVNKVSTDILEQGNNVLVLNGGTATV